MKSIEKSADKIFQKILKFDLTRKNLTSTPEEAGVYVFWSKEKVPLYIGKSNNLKRRIISYKLKKLGVKTKKMISLATYFSNVLVSSDLEALLLEAYLIRTLKPPFNIQLKDDKHPLYIKITNDDFPQVITARKIDIDNTSIYFGPFPSSYNVKSTLKLIRKIIPFAQHPPSQKPCLYSQIGLCNPCPSTINALTNRNARRSLTKRYRRNITLIKKLLEGKSKAVIASLEKEMAKSAKVEDFENASIIRDKITKLNYITQPITPVKAFLNNPNLLEDIRLNELHELKHFISPYIVLPKIFTRIECYDIAHISGSKPTASMVTFINGESEKSLYRHFRINQKNGANDIASLGEVAKRRLKYLADWGTPDLIIVDGGKSQVNIFLNYFNKVDKTIAIIGLTKRLETLVIPQKDGNFILLKTPHGPIRNLVQRLRDEAHRFARRYHHHLLRKELLGDYKKI